MVRKDGVRWDRRAALIAGLVGLALTMVWIAFVAGLEPTDRAKTALAGQPADPAASSGPRPHLSPSTE